jgi:hypothetical protein
LLLASGDVTSAFGLEDTSGALMRFFFGDYSNEDLIENLALLSVEEIIEEPALVTVNGQKAAKAVYTTKDGRTVIETIIIKETSALYVFSDFPSEKNQDFRLLIEDVISTIEIK